MKNQAIQAAHERLSQALTELTRLHHLLLQRFVKGKTSERDLALITKAEMAVERAAAAYKEIAGE